MLNVGQLGRYPLERDEPTQTTGLFHRMRLPLPKSQQRGLDELLGDIRNMLRRQESHYDLPLVDLFNDMTGGMRTAEQRRKYGEKAAKFARELIIQTVKNYAQQSGNYALLNMLDRFEDYNPSKPMQPKRKPQKTVKPQLSEKEKDYASIIAVIEKLGRPVRPLTARRTEKRAAVIWGVPTFTKRQLAHQHENHRPEITTFVTALPASNISVAGPVALPVGICPRTPRLQLL